MFFPPEFSYAFFPFSYRAELRGSINGHLPGTFRLKAVGARNGLNPAAGLVVLIETSETAG